MINATNNISFTGVNLFYIRRNSKQGKLLLEAAQDPLLKGQIKALERHGMNLDIVRNFDHDSRPTKSVNLWLDYGQKYTPKDSMNPIQGVNREIKTVDDAKLLIAKGITKSISFMKKHFELLTRFKKHLKN